MYSLLHYSLDETSGSVEERRQFPVITPVHTSPWIICPKPNPAARLRLFCFPYAGGGASIYREWPDSFQRNIEICCIQLPGRENRSREALMKNLSQVVLSLQPQLLPFLDKPFAFFGYSLGALISFETASSLRNSAGLAPRHLFVAAHCAPHLFKPDPLLYTLPSSLLIENLRQLQGTPEELFQMPEILELMLPLIRADFMIRETYSYNPQASRLSCPVTDFGGKEDSIPMEEVQAWEHETEGLFACHMLNGGHFFLRSDKAQLLRLVSEALNATMC